MERGKKAEKTRNIYFSKRQDHYVHYVGNSQLRIDVLI